MEGRFQPNRGWVGCKLNLATDHITTGTSMAIMAAEGITRERIMIPLDFNGGAFKWGINTSGTMFGGKDKMAFLW
jgi:hypothetical protein